MPKQGRQQRTSWFGCSFEYYRIFEKWEFNESGTMRAFRFRDDNPTTPNLQKWWLSNRSSMSAPNHPLRQSAMCFVDSGTFNRKRQLLPSSCFPSATDHGNVDNYGYITPSDTLWNTVPYDISHQTPSWNDNNAQTTRLSQNKATQPTLPLLTVTVTCPFPPITLIFVSASPITRPLSEPIYRKDASRCVVILSATRFEKFAFGFHYNIVVHHDDSHTYVDIYSYAMNSFWLLQLLHFIVLDHCQWNTTQSPLIWKAKIMSIITGESFSNHPTRRKLPRWKLASLGQAVHDRVRLLQSILSQIGWFHRKYF